MIPVALALLIGLACLAVGAVLADPVLLVAGATGVWLAPIGFRESRAEVARAYHGPGSIPPPRAPTALEAAHDADVVGRIEVDELERRVEAALAPAPPVQQDFDRLVRTAKARAALEARRRAELSLSTPQGWRVEARFADTSQPIPDRR